MTLNAIHPFLYDAIAHRQRDITSILLGYLRRTAIPLGPAATLRPLAFRVGAGRTRVASIGERPRVQNHCTPRRIEYQSFQESETRTMP